MTALSNPFAEIGRATVDAAARAARISLDGAERAMSVQLEYAKGAFTQAAHTARAVSQVKVKIIGTAQCERCWFDGVWHVASLFFSANC